MCFSNDDTRRQGFLHELAGGGGGGSNSPSPVLLWAVKEFQLTLSFLYVKLSVVCCFRHKSHICFQQVLFGWWIARVAELYFITHSIWRAGLFEFVLKKNLSVFRVTLGNHWEGMCEAADGNRCYSLQNVKNLLLLRLLVLIFLCLDNISRGEKNRSYYLNSSV